MGQIWFQNLLSEIQVVRLDRFSLPHSFDDCGKKSLSRAFVAFGDYMRLLMKIQMHPILPSSWFLSNSHISPKFKESMLRVPCHHKAQIRCVIGLLRGWFLDPPCSGLILEQMSLFLDDFCHAPAFCSNVRVHRYFVELNAPPARWAQKSSKQYFLRKQMWDRSGFKTYQLKFKLYAEVVFVAP